MMIGRMSDTQSVHAVPSVPFETFQSRVHEGGVTILDVLPQQAYASAHVPGAINIPLPELRARAGDELPDRSREIIVYCGGPT